MLSKLSRDTVFSSPKKKRKGESRVGTSRCLPWTTSRTPARVSPYAMQVVGLTGAYPKCELGWPWKEECTAAAGSKDLRNEDCSLEEEETLVAEEETLSFDGRE